MIHRALRDNTNAKWYVIPSSGFSMVHECDRRTDRRTDYATLTSVAIADIAEAFVALVK